MKNVFIRGYAQESYERLILQKNNIFFAGLWELNDRYYISIDKRSKNITEAELNEISAWFHDSCRIVGTPVGIVREVPFGAVTVPARTSTQLSQHHGVPFTTPEFNKLLKTILPKDFPRFGVHSDHGGIRLEVETDISQEQKLEVDLALANLGFHIEAEIVVNKKAWQHPRAKKHESDAAKNSPPRIIKTALEEDEDFWVDSRLSLFAEGNTDRHHYLNRFNSRESCSCLINSTNFEPKNIRAYLTLYKLIWIAIPLSTRIDSFFKGFNITESEIIHLAINGRVGFIVPGKLPMYPLGFLAKIMEACPNSVIFSKRLAAASIAESRRRNPLLFPNLNNVERRSVLDLLANIKDEKSSSLPTIFIEHFSKVWPALEYSFSDLGAIGMMRNGLSRVAEGIAKEQHGIELGAIIYETMASVEWAAALGAAYSPIRTDEFNEGPLAEFSASIMTGVKQQNLIAPVCDMDILINGVLCLDNDASILEIEDAFRGPDLLLLQKIIYEHADSNEALLEYINKLNIQIKKFEKNQKKLKRMDLLGLVSAASAIGGALTAPAAVTAAAYIPISAWILQKVFLQSDSFAQGPILDWIRAKSSMTTQDAVLISRLRQNMGKLTH